MCLTDTIRLHEDNVRIKTMLEVLYLYESFNINLLTQEVKNEKRVDY
jgi:hypothetical protein